MLQIHLLLKKNAGKLIVFSLCFIILMFNFISVCADEEEGQIPSSAAFEVSTEIPTDDSNNIIIEQPHNIVAQGGDTISFNVKVSDNSLVESFLWVYSPDGGVSWTTASSLTGYDTDTLTLIVNRYRATWKYKCILDLKNGDTLETRIASIISPSEQVTEQVTELPTNGFIKNIGDDISSNDLLLIIVVMVLLLIVIAVIRIIL